MAFKDLRHVHRHNLATLRRRPLSEISGALGDLGTLLPLMIALALQGAVSLPSTLVFSGVFNILTGVVFGVPLPVQPMKAIAAAAIASHASQSDTLAAGALVGAAVGFLSVTGLLRWLTARVPVPVVKGIQFGAGLQLVIAGGGRMLRPLGWVGPSPFDNRVWAIAAFLMLVLTARSSTRRFPYALLVFLAGLVLAILTIATTTDDHNNNNRWPSFEIWRPYTVIPAFGHARAWSMAVAQLPLTTLNSVIAAAALAAELMGDGSSHLRTPTVTELGLSVAAMNLVGCWFGAMPVCHGAGGLAAQYRFGARSGASVVLLGAAKLVLGLVLGGRTLLGLLGSFPGALLGVLVVAAGLELAKVGQSLNHGAPDLWEDTAAATTTTGGGGVTEVIKRAQRHLSDEERAERWAVMMVTAGCLLAFQNDAVGFVAGMGTAWAYAVARTVERRWDSSSLARGERRPLLRWP